MLQCPHCFSTRTRQLNTGRKLVGGASALLGVSLGFFASSSTLRLTSTAVSTTTSPMNVVTQVALASLSAGYLCAKEGLKLGSLLDDKALDNVECLKCRHQFRAATKAKEDITIA